MNDKVDGEPNNLVNKAPQQPEAKSAAADLTSLELGQENAAQINPPEERNVARGGVSGRAGRNMVFLGLSFASQTVSALLILVMIGRMAGVENAGLWAYVIAFLDMFAVLMDFGTTRMLVPEIARRRQESNILLGSALTLGVLLGVIALIALAIIAKLGIFDHTSSTIQALYLAGVGLVFATLNLSVRSAFRANDRFDLEAINTILLATALVASTFVILYLEVPFIWLFGATTLVYFIVLLQSWWLYNRYVGHLAFHFDRDMVFSHVARKSLTFMLINLLYRAYRRVDILILGFFLGPLSVGFYAIVTNLFYRLDAITRLFMVSLLPSMSRDYSSHRERFSHTLNKALKLQLLIVVPLAIGGFVLARQLIHLLFGSDFEPSVIFFQLLILVIPLRFINRTFTISLTAMDLQKRIVIAMSITVLFNIVANLILIPQYEAMGATITSMASEVMLLILTYLSLTLAVRRNINWLALARLLPGLLIVIPLLYVTREWPLWISLTLALAVYFLSLFLVRAISVKEMRTFIRALDPSRILPVSIRQRLTGLRGSRVHDGGY